MSKKVKNLPAGEAAALMARCRRGHEASWRALVDMYQNLVYSVAIRKGLSTDEAGDVFQQTFLALYRNLDRIDDPERLPKWLAVTASREALRVIRFRSETVSTEDLEAILESDELNAEEMATQAAESESVRLSLHVLGGKCRDLLTWLYVEERSYQEISEKGFPMGAIGPTRARCLEKLRQILIKSGVLEDVSKREKEGSRTV